MAEKLEIKEHERAFLIKVEKFDLSPWLRKALDESANVTAVYDGLPLEELLMLDNLSDTTYPGLRWNLRRQRGRYLLTLLHPHNIMGNHVKGEP